CVVPFFGLLFHAISLCAPHEGALYCCQNGISSMPSSIVGTGAACCCTVCCACGCACGCCFPPLYVATADTQLPLRSWPSSPVISHTCNFMAMIFPVSASAKSESSGALSSCTNLPPALASIAANMRLALSAFAASSSSTRTFWKITLFLYCSACNTCLRILMYLSPWYSAQLACCIAAMHPVFAGIGSKSHPPDSKDVPTVL